MDCCTSKEDWAVYIDFDSERSQGSVIKLVLFDNVGIHNNCKYYSVKIVHFIYTVSFCTHFSVVSSEYIENALYFSILLAEHHKGTGIFSAT